MKKLISTLFICTTILTACSPKEPVEAITAGSIAEITAATTAIETKAPAYAYETDTDLSDYIQDQQQTSSILTGSYYLQLSSDPSDVFVPCLSLFDDGTFGFTYDLLSSYYSNGAYDVVDKKITLNTDDGKYQYVFLMKDNGELIFQAGESSDVELIQPNFGTKITDGSIFSIKNPRETISSPSLDSPPQCILVPNTSGNEPPMVLSSGGYSWSYEKDGENIETVACGFHPLDPLVRKNTEPVKPGSYTLSYSEIPDSIVIKAWDGDIAMEQEEMGDAEYRETTLTPDNAQLTLEENQVYEITLTYNKSQNRTFGGVAYYVMVTE